MLIQTHTSTIKKHQYCYQQIHTMQRQLYLITQQFRDNPLSTESISSITHTRVLRSKSIHTSTKLLSETLGRSHAMSDTSLVAAAAAVQIHDAHWLRQKSAVQAGEMSGLAASDPQQFNERTEEEVEISAQRYKKIRIRAHSWVVRSYILQHD